MTHLLAALLVVAVTVPGAAHRWQHGAHTATGQATYGTMGFRGEVVPGTTTTTYGTMGQRR